MQAYIKNVCIAKKKLYTHFLVIRYKIDTKNNIRDIVI